MDALISVLIIVGVVTALFVAKKYWLKGALLGAVIWILSLGFSFVNCFSLDGSHPYPTFCGAAPFVLSPLYAFFVNSLDMFSGILVAVFGIIFFSVIGAVIGWFYERKIKNGRVINEQIK